jgi:hypothetical protein
MAYDGTGGPRAAERGILGGQAVVRIDGALDAWQQRGQDVRARLQAPAGALHERAARSRSPHDRGHGRRRRRQGSCAHAPPTRSARTPRTLTLTPSFCGLRVTGGGGAGGAPPARRHCMITACASSVSSWSRKSSTSAAACGACHWVSTRASHRVLTHTHPSTSSASSPKPLSSLMRTDADPPRPSPAAAAAFLGGGSQPAHSLPGALHCVNQQTGAAAVCPQTRKGLGCPSGQCPLHWESGVHRWWSAQLPQSEYPDEESPPLCGRATSESNASGSNADEAREEPLCTAHAERLPWTSLRTTRVPYPPPHPQHSTAQHSPVRSAPCNSPHPLHHCAQASSV